MSAPNWATVMNEAVADIDRRAASCRRLLADLKPDESSHVRSRLAAKAQAYAHAADLVRQHVRIALNDAEMAGEIPDAISASAELERPACGHTFHYKVIRDRKAVRLGGRGQASVYDEPCPSAL